MSLTQKRHGWLISYHAKLLSGEDKGNVQPTAIKREHLHQLNNYQRLKQDSTPESTSAFTGYFQYFTYPDIHSMQSQRIVAKARAVQITPHSKKTEVHLPVFHEIFNTTRNFDVLLTVHFCIFISVFNQFDAQNLFHKKFCFMPLHVSSTCVHHQEVKIVLYSLWYHHIYRWHETATYRCDDTRGGVMQF